MSYDQYKPFVPWRSRMGDRSEDPRCPICRTHPCVCYDGAADEGDGKCLRCGATWVACQCAGGPKTDEKQT